MSHESKALLRASKRYARENRWLSWWHLGSALVLFVALLVATCLHALPWPVRVLSSVIAGMMIVRLFIVYHDYQHGTILKGSPLAAGLMTAYGLVTLNPPSIWNRSHNYHHKHNAKIYGTAIGSYPLMTVASYWAATPRERFMYRVSRHAITIALGYITIFLYGMCIRSLVINPRLHFDSALAIFVHAAVDPYSLVQPISRLIREMSAEQPIERPAVLEDVKAEVLAPNRLNALVFGGFAAVAMAIAVVGVAGVLAFSVSGRTREFAIRLAVGSPPRHVLTGVLAEGAVIGIIGVVAGAAGGFILARIAAAFIEGTQVPDAIPVAAAALILLAAAVAASLLPAARAARVDVMDALRAD